MARRRGIGAMIVDVHRAGGHAKCRWRGSDRRHYGRFKSGVPAGGRMEALVAFIRSHIIERRIVGYRDVQRVARIYVQGGILEAIRGHEAKQLSAHRIGRRLVRKLDIQHSVIAIKRRRVLDYATCRESGAGIGNRWYGRWRSMRRWGRGLCKRAYGDDN